MKNYRHYVLLVLLLFTPLLPAQEQLLDVLSKEADRNLELLRQEEVPAYYISYRVYQNSDQTFSSQFGGSDTPVREESRMLHVIVRVGDVQLDNTHEVKGDFFGSQNEGQSILFPLSDDPEAIRLALWVATDKYYKNAVQRYKKVKANVAVSVEAEDKSPDFTKESAEVYIEKKLTLKDLKYDENEIERKLNKYTSLFLKNKDILSGDAFFRAGIQQMYFADTEGRKIFQNDASVRLGLNAYTIANDGMSLPLYVSYFGFKASDLPSDKKILADVAEMSDMLSQLKKAPVADSYTGPAILSSKATGVFFHEFFGHRVEGARMKLEGDAQTFKKKVSQSVLPGDMSVYFDPTLKEYKNTLLSGRYVFDDEGIRGQRVDVVDKGTLKSFLMSRTPIDGFLNSNGHGRGMIYYDPVTRQSNMIVETNNPFTPGELRAKLRDELKKQGKPYGYYFGEVSGGFTNTTRFDANAFNVTPLIVYRIYADGRPDELVRGVNLIGTPLSVFSQIMACGDDYEVFNGYCGAESGSIPVSCVAPTMLIKTVETQKSGKSTAQPPVLERPSVNF
ncbi:TldD/PmbA family protein [Coprobacter tertius]|uniref:Metallopeptidase TldD-related protein n=1 Tax=Coprobacter tertius TaxID=2944915 RepID=A0ABT1MDD3_9BACT|nr:metallopeptidase TldD-related protein [Coprobacter tertius]MCP9610642.1 metallopeptidase TldD-related protein [Coprobacter tertius]